ncbi:MAG: metallophosphoesterase family protein [Lachnospiraceae bacterium]|nr:metallophosphoesterase family protein [Lachnospiraceae bacterium]
MSTYFIADTHFSDDSILRYENRPFENIDEMNKVLVDNWNKTVSKDDTVFLVGDVGEEKYLRELNGEIILIRGNHDKLTEEEYKKLGVKAVYEYPIIYKEFWMVSHEPMYVNRNAPYANIFGHIHSNPQYISVSPRSFCISAERIGYTPILFEEIAAKVKEADKECK